MNVFKRIEEARLQLRLNKGEVCKELGIGRTMLHYLKTGDRELSAKALKALERLEGIAHRSKESDARIMGASNDATSQRDFENLLTARTERDTANKKLNKAKRELLQLRKRIDQVLKDLEAS